MATHFLYNASNLIKLYRQPSYDTLALTVPNNTYVTVLSEFEGSNCSLHKIEFNGKNYYVDVADVKRSANTPESAPYVCTVEYINNFIQPDWTMMEPDVPYYDSSDKTYTIPIITNYTKIDNKELFIKDSIRTGTKKLLDFYYKDSSDENVDKLLSYFEFAFFKDYYVRPISNSRIKSLVSIPKKYFDAIPAKDILLDIPQNSQVFNLSTKDLRNKLFYIKNVMNFYDKALSSSNVQIQNFSFSKEFKKLINFYQKLYNIFSLNDIQIKDNVDETLEILLDECGRFYSASLRVNNVCKYPLVGLNHLRNNDYGRSQRTLNLFKHIDSLYFIDPCRMSLSDFVEKYVLYPPIITAAAQNLLDQNQLDFDKMLSFVNSTTQTLNSISLKTSISNEFENKYSLELKKSIDHLKKYYSWESFYDKDKDIFKDLNFTEDLTKLQNKKTSGTDFEKFQASLIPNNIENQSRQRKNAIKFVYSVLSLNQILCKLGPKALNCLLNLLATTIGTNNGVNNSLSLIATTTYSLEEIKTKVFPFLSKEEKQIVLSELMEQFCLTNSDLVDVLKKSKNLTKTEIQKYSSYSFDMLKQTILNEIIT